jgi:hypothetical protein
VKLRVEFIGLAGAGKTTAATRLLDLARRSGAVVLGPSASIDLALRRRHDGLLKNLLKALPPAAWRRFLGPEHALAELTRFCAPRPGLLSALFAAFETHSHDEQDRFIVLESFFLSFVEHQLRREHLRDHESVIVDEGLAQRVLSLFGLSPVGVEEGALDRFIEHLPGPDVLAWMDTGPEVCLERILVRPRGPRPWFRALEREEQLELLEEAAARLAKIVAAFERRGCRVVRLHGSIDRALEKLAAALR